MNPLAAWYLWCAYMAAYCAPSYVAYARQVPNRGSVAVVNLLLGWTAIGWVVSLAMACRSKPRSPRTPIGSSGPAYFPGAWN